MVALDAGSSPVPFTKPKETTMKKIEKEITVTRYMAFDGTEFDTETGCQNFEGSAFGALMQQLESRIVKKSNELSMVGTGSPCTACYAIVPRTRHDIFVLNQILQMVDGEQRAESTDCDMPVLLCVHLRCNTVMAAYLIRPQEIVQNAGNGEFTVVSTIKETKKK